MHVKQYDLQGNLVVSVIGNRNNGQIAMYDDQGTSIFNAEEVIEKISTTFLPTLYSFQRVATFPVYDRITLDRQTMYLYEDVSSAVHTTYDIGSFSGTLGVFVTSVVISLGVSMVIANALAADILSAGLAILVGEILEISTSITLAADKYHLSYYGQDSKTGRKSATYDQTYRYIITDETSNKLNNVYYDGSCYYDANDDTPTLKLTQYIVPNLYGPNYEWDRW